MSRANPPHAGDSEPPPRPPGCPAPGRSSRLGSQYDAKPRRPEHAKHAPVPGGISRSFNGREAFRRTRSLAVQRRWHPGHALMVAVVEDPHKIPRYFVVFGFYENFGGDETSAIPVG